MAAISRSRASRRSGSAVLEAAGDRVAGLRLAFGDFQVAGADRAGLPGDLEAFTAGQRTDVRRPKP